MKKNFKLYTISIVLIISLLSLLVQTACHKADNEVQYYIIKYNVTEGGKIKGEALQIIEKGFDCEEVTAVPFDGFIFVKWSDGLTDANRQDINIGSDFTVTAEFKIVE